MKATIISKAPHIAHENEADTLMNGLRNAAAVVADVPRYPSRQLTRRGSGHGCGPQALCLVPALQLFVLVIRPQTQISSINNPGCLALVDSTGGFTGHWGFYGVVLRYGLVLFCFPGCTSQLRQCCSRAACKRKCHCKCKCKCVYRWHWLACCM